MESGTCVSSDTCDPRFAISLINFGTGRRTLLGTNYVLGTFMDADSVRFGECSTIRSDSIRAGVQNPLTFVFPTTLFTPGVRI